MMLSIEELVQAREVVDGILVDIGLSNYVFDIEPHNSQWKVNIECAAHGRWETCRFEVDRELLGNAQLGSEARAGLIQLWAERLAGNAHRHD